jgi:hypothetical protein
MNVISMYCMNKKHEALKKKIKQLRKTAKWYYVQEQDGFHLFGGCDTHIIQESVDVGAAIKVLGLSESNALYRYMKREHRLEEFNSHSNMPDETSIDWAKWMVIEAERLTYKKQFPKYFN